METRSALAWLAGGVVVLGIALALWPTHIAGGDVGCGSALAPSSTEASGEEFGDALRDLYRGGDGSDDGGYVAQCEDRVGTQRMIAFPVAIVGALVGCFLVMTAPRKAGGPVGSDEPSVQAEADGKS